MTVDFVLTGDGSDDTESLNVSNGYAETICNLLGRHPPISHPKDFRETLRRLRDLRARDFTTPTTSGPNWTNFCRDEDDIRRYIRILITMCEQAIEKKLTLERW